jgi:hypothetical protein
MSTDRTWGWGRNLLWASVMPLAMVGVTLLVAIGIGVIPLNGCDAERKKKISNLAGLDFEVTDTDCDVGLYKGAAMSVFVSKTGEGEKALLFKFEPEDDDLLPEIKVEQQNSTILVFHFAYLVHLFAKGSLAQHDSKIRHRPHRLSQGGQNSRSGFADREAMRIRRH